MSKVNENRPGYKKTKIGWIPEDWEIDKIKDSYLICNNLRYPINVEERKKIQGEYPYYGPTGILDYINHYKVGGKYVLIGEDGDHFLKYYIKPQTILVIGKFNVNNHAHIIKGKNKNSSEWFFWFFNHRNIVPYLSRLGAGRYKLNKEE
ncbi:MAG: restriction endonuclease subunit S [Spirochaetales bacterium]|nr:restriction endonuclease subunit S [Spirochaetales bacterium]